MKIKNLTLLFVLCTIFATGIFAQDVKSILNKHFKATGQEKLTKLESFYMEGKMTQAGMEIPMKIYFKKPDKFRMEMTFNGQEMITAYNGTTAWAINPAMGNQPQEIPSEQIKPTLDQMDMDGLLYNYEKKGKQITYKGKKNIADEETYELLVTDKEVATTTVYIGTSDFLIKQTVTTQNMQGQTIEVITEMSDYRDVEGTKAAYKISSKMAGMPPSDMIIETYEMGKPINDLIFEWVK